MKDLIVTMLQEDLAWENKTRNLAVFRERMSSLKGKTHLVLLPEMFNTGFTMNAAAMHEGMDGPTVQWLLDNARELNAHVAGTLIVGDGGGFFNRMVWAEPQGKLHIYNKRHLFRMAGENGIFSPGNENITIDCRGWRVRPFICYDLRFPVWSRNRNNDYDMAVYFANWPERRARHWQVLLQARAMENQAYVAGVNRVGKDAKGIRYTGDSCIIDPWGNDAVRLDAEAGTATAVLSGSMLTSCRRDFPVWQDADTDFCGSGNQGGP
ncbi:MAG: amidohydrolase [Spirochaetae bacterium HGW-Spirochaetae-1]|jgi:predicted amidohydrolase|nr:MAG: amidohydrolase [Spirochaetae bacterium HGW-Spirochaetae-1]